jgi:cytochrome c biogenesis protein CcmG/thiol:disulfide interchange protein DsbE
MQHSARRLALLAILPMVMVSRAVVAVDLGKPAPGLVVPEVEGQTFDLSTLRGKVVIVNFWATWCVPCREEMPILEAFYRAHHGQGLEVIGLSMDRSRDREAVRKLMQSVSYPIALASDAKVNGFGAVRALPVTYVVDETGTVRASLASDKPLTEKRLEDVVLPLLSTQDTTPAPPSPNRRGESGKVGVQENPAGSQPASLLEVCGCGRRAPRKALERRQDRA